MKRPIFYLLLMFGVFACSKSHEKEAQERIEKFLQENAHDAKSYEFISIASSDTFTLADSIKNVIFEAENDFYYYSRELKASLESAKRYKENMERSEYPELYETGYKNYSMEAETYKKKMQVAEEALKIEKNKLSELQTDMSKNEVIWEEYTLNFRIKNLMGAYFKTSASIQYFPSKNAWGQVKVAPNPMEKIMQD